MSEQIGPHSVLPADRRAVTLTTSDGLSLVGELALPLAGPPLGTVVCLHPLPTDGGNMDSHVFRKMAWRLPALAQLAVLRFNTRGTSSAEGASEGTFTWAEDECKDLAAALELVELTPDVPGGLPRPWLVGWSFGTELVLRYGSLDPEPLGGILLSPPLRTVTDAHLDLWAADGRPLLVLVPELDDYLRPAEATARFARVPQARIVGVDGAKHLWVGERYVRRVLDEIVQQVLPGHAPLATTWP